MQSDKSFPTDAIAPDKGTIPPIIYEVGIDAIEAVDDADEVVNGTVLVFPGVVAVGAGLEVEVDAQPAITKISINKMMRTPGK
jgi:hypothetical protein